MEKPNEFKVISNQGELKTTDSIITIVFNENKKVMMHVKNLEVAIEYFLSKPIKPVV